MQGTWGFGLSTPLGSPLGEHCTNVEIPLVAAACPAACLQHACSTTQACHLACPLACTNSTESPQAMLWSGAVPMHQVRSSEHTECSRECQVSGCPDTRMTRMPGCRVNQMPPCLHQHTSHQDRPCKCLLRTCTEGHPDERTAAMLWQTCRGQTAPHRFRVVSTCNMCSGGLVAGGWAHHRHCLALCHKAPLGCTGSGLCSTLGSQPAAGQAGMGETSALTENHRSG